MVELISEVEQDELAAGVRRDQQQRWQEGQRVLLESYLPGRPELLADESRFLDLLYGEVLLREEFGERPELEEYLARFPQYEQQLRRQFLVHRAMAVSGEGPAGDLADNIASTVSLAATGCRDEGRMEAAPPAAGGEFRSAAAGEIQVPGYEILGEVGRGGMGVVYRARQLSLNRIVALKMVLSGVHAGPQAAARFRSEAEAVAMLQHPNIVQIYEVGEHEGWPYLALEFVDGPSLAQVIRSVPQAPAAAARLVATLAHAVQAAHRQGIVHRDLKPGNVLLAGRHEDSLAGARLRPGRETRAQSAGGVGRPAPSAARPARPGRETRAQLAGGVGRPAPSAARPARPGRETRAQRDGADREYGEPKITDFGLAKRLEAGAGLTQTGDILGTPSYMAPEQASGRTHELGTPVDIYALGAILYELLTGRPPFRGANPLDTLEQVRLAEPVPPRRLQPKVPVDLESICLKCLQKSPTRRYASAGALARDLEQFVAGKPILARQVTAAERGWKWARRRPAAAGLVAVILIAACSLLAVWGRFTSKLQVERDQAQHDRTEAVWQRGVAADERDRARQLLYDAQINLAEQAWRDADIRRLQDLLDAQLPAPGEADRRGPEWYYLQQLCHAELLTLRGHTGFVRHAAFSPDGRLLASAGDDQLAKIWDLATGSELFALEGHASYVSAVAFSPDSQRLATASGDQTVRIWDVASGQRLWTLRGHLAAVYDAAFSPDGRQLASASGDQTVRIWDATTGEMLRSLPGHVATVYGVAFAPSSNRLASAGRDGTILLWDLVQGTSTVLQQPELGAQPLAATLDLGLAYSSDGLYLAAGCQDHTVRIWDAGDGHLVQTLRGHTGEITGVAFAPDGQRLASSSWDRTVRVWDVASGRQERVFRGHTGFALAVAYHPDGRRLASAGREIKVWDVGADQESRPLWGHAGAVHGLAIQPGGRLLAAASQDGTVRVWDRVTGEQQAVLRGHAGPVLDVAFSRDGRYLASAGQDRTARIWPLEDLGRELMLKGHTDWVFGVAFSPDGTLLASASRDQTVRLWDVATGASSRTLRGHASFVQAVAFHPDGGSVASGARDGSLKIWEVGGEQRVLSLAGHASSVASIAFSPDGTLLASAGVDRAGNVIKLWDAAGGELIQVLSGHAQAINGIAFDPGGLRLISCSGSLGRPGEIKLWDLDTGQELLTLRGHDDEVTGVAFGSDARFWASASRDGSLRIWDAPVRQPARSR